MLFRLHPCVSCCSDCSPVFPAVLTPPLCFLLFRLYPCVSCCSDCTPVFPAVPTVPLCFLLFRLHPCVSCCSDCSPVFPAVLTAPPVLQECGEWPVGGPLDAGRRSCSGTSSHSCPYILLFSWYIIIIIDLTLSPCL